MSVVKAKTLAEMAAEAPPGSGSVIVDMTPEMAAQWLTHNFVRNRPLNQNTVLRYAIAMEEGRWHLGPDSIAVTNDLRLVSGQHRLQAIVLSGCTVQLSVMFNIDPAMIPNIDAHRPRTPGNVFVLAGFDHASVLAPMVQLLLRYETSAAGKDARARIRLSGVRNFDRDVLLREAYSHPGVQESAAFIDVEEIRSGLRGIANLSAAALLHYLASRKGKREQVEQFIATLASGEGLSAGSPILALRRKMVESRAGGHKYDEQAKLNLLVRAWKFYEAGENVDKLMPGKSKNAFPLI